MKILILNQYFSPDSSASAQFLGQLATDLAAFHEVTVVAGRPSYNASTATDDVQQGKRRRGFLSRESMGKVRILRMWSTTYPRQAGMRGRIANYLSYLTSASIGAFRAPRPDVVMTWTDPPPIASVGAMVARLRRAPLVLSMQDITPEAPIATGDLTNPTLIRLLRANAHFSLKRAAVVVSIGRDMNARLEALGVEPSRIELIENWMDTDLVRPLEGPSHFRAEQGWGDRFVVMHSGNVGLSQDLDTLMGAADLLAGELDILFAVVGEGARKEELQAETVRRGLTNLVFLPFQPEEALADSLGAADIHVVSHERGASGFQVPSKLYGVLAAGKPVLASVDDWAEVALTIEENQCGVRSEPGDPASMAAAIRRLRDDPKLAQLGRNARLAAETRYSRTRATEAYRHTLERVDRKP